MNRPSRLGVIAPSSNTVLEPETIALLPGDRSTTVHFARFHVTKISSDADSLAQFERDAVTTAARQLADAKVDLILWGGTAASWLGFAWDEDLIAAISGETGIRATTAVCAINVALQEAGARTIGLVTPYVESLETRIIDNYRRIGIETLSSERLDLTENTAYADVPAETIADMVRRVAKSGSNQPDAVVIMCTNLAGASVSPRLSSELGVPVLDSVRVATEYALKLLR